MGFKQFLQNAGAAFANTAAALAEFGRDKVGPALDHFGQRHLGPALEQTGAALYKFGEKQLGPAMGVAGAVMCDFGEQKLIPALAHAYEDAAKALDHFGQQHVGPALEATGAALHEFGEKKLDPALAVTGTALHEFGEKQVGPALVVTAAALMNFGEKQVSSALATTSQWIEKNPAQTAMIASSVVTLAIPGLISGPLLWAFGWGGSGVRADLVAAAMQASLGNVAAGCAFATVQSSAIGRYDMAIVHGVLRAGAAVLGAAGLGGASNATVAVEAEDISEDDEKFIDVRSDEEVRVQSGFVLVGYGCGL